jgi:SNF2 family DNA or RNA helicase
MSSRKEDLMPHQMRAIERLSQADQPGLILMHGLGSGKTRSSIEAYKKLGIPAEVVLPAALQGNYRKELDKWIGRVPRDVNIQSQQALARQGADPRDFQDKLLVVDEAHRLRNPGNKLYQTLKKTLPAKRLLLTGTPMYNQPSDISKLVNLASGESMLPENPKDFEREYISEEKISPTILQRLLGVRPGSRLGVKNPEKLRKIFNKMIDYHEGSKEYFPAVSEEIHNVPMSDRQKELYDTLMGKMPWYMRMKVRAGLPPNRKELDKLVPFLTGARMVGNTSASFEKDQNMAVSPKIREAADFLKKQIASDPSYKGLVYSNYLDSGINPYKRLLEEAKIPFGEFTGDIDSRTREQLVRDYNKDKLKALLISSAGGEGLDLKGTRLVQVLEPHFNNEKIRQVIGRAARYKSHEALPEEKRKVLVQKYLSSLNPSFAERLFGKTPTSTDQYLQQMADDKERLNREFINLIRNKNSLG